MVPTGAGHQMFGTESGAYSINESAKTKLVLAFFDSPFQLVL